MVDDANVEVLDLLLKLGLFNTVMVNHCSQTVKRIHRTTHISPLKLRVLLAAFLKLTLEFHEMHFTLP